MFQIYTGDGKGKTTAAIGLTLRSLGSNKKVVFIQFLKHQKSGEEIILKKLKNLTFRKYGINEFISKKDNKIIINNTQLSTLKKKILMKKLKDQIFNGIKYTYKVIDSKKVDILILDEINLAIYFNLVSLKDTNKIIDKCKDKIELIFTGRKANKDIIKKADLVTEMKEIKHYFFKNIIARKGIEY